MLLLSQHLDAVLDEFAAIIRDAEGGSPSEDSLEDDSLVVRIRCVEDGAQDEDAILLLLHLVKVEEHGVTNSLSKLRSTSLEDPLDDSAPELIKTVLCYVVGDGSDDGAHIW